MLDAIPGTFVDESVQRLKWIPVSHLPHGARGYYASCDDGFLRAIVGLEPAGKDGEMIWHISVSHVNKSLKHDRYPSWDELKHAKYQLVPDDVPMVLIFPSKAAKYVDVSPNCLHLWQAEEGIDR